MVAGLAAVCLIFYPSPAAAESAGQLSQQIAAGQARASLLSSAIGAATSRLQHLGTGISTLQRQIARIQTDLDAKVAQLNIVRRKLSVARARLVQLEAYARRAELVLARQLVGTYESPPPNLVSVVLEATGFQNLLEQLSFAQRIRDHDQLVIAHVRAARSRVAAQAIRLGRLEMRAQALAVRAANERDRVSRASLLLGDQQLAVARSRNAKAGQLAFTRRAVAALQGTLSALRAAQAAQSAARSQNAGTAGSSQPAGSSPVSTAGGFTFPLPKGSASPPGTWSLDDGVDISAPGGTPEFAVCSGTVVLHGIGGFGPSAPVLHCDTPLSGYAYVYYGHAGPGNWTAVGSHVSAGQAISEVGSGIVGISTGPHIEIGFADSSGTPIGPSSAPTMMSLLQSSYAP